MRLISFWSSRVTLHLLIRTSDLKERELVSGVPGLKRLESVEEQTVLNQMLLGLSRIPGVGLITNRNGGVDASRGDTNDGVCWCWVQALDRNHISMFLFGESCLNFRNVSRRFLWRNNNLVHIVPFT